MTLPIFLFSMMSCRLFIIVCQAYRFLVSLHAFATTSSGCSPLRTGRKTLLAKEEGGSTTYLLREHVPGACKKAAGLPAAFSRMRLKIALDVCGRSILPVKA